MLFCYVTGPVWNMEDSTSKGLRLSTGRLVGYLKHRERESAMKRVFVGILLVLSSGCHATKGRRFELPRQPTIEVRDRLLKLHPDWKATDFNGEISQPGSEERGSASFFNNGLLQRDLDFRWPGEVLIPDEQPLPRHAILGQAPSVINRYLDLPALSEEKWKGGVYVRGRWNSGKADESPGWHGPRILIRADCLFFGDKEMLKQIDTDLQ